MQFARKRVLASAMLASALLGLLGMPVVATAAEQSPDNPTTHSESTTTVVLKNAVIHPLGGQPSFSGSILVKDGKISALGSSIEAPSDARVIDLAGCQVIPGLIESRGKLWLTPAGVTETNTKAELNVVDAIDPWSEDWRELAAQGITAVYAQPGSGSSLGGYGAVLRVGPHSTPDAIIMKQKVAVQAAIGITGATSKDRYTQIQALDKLLESAKEKKKTPESGKPKTADKKSDPAKSKKTETEKTKPADAKSTTAAKTPDKPKKPEDVTKIVLRRILKKEIPLHVEVHHSDAARQLIELAKKHDIRLVLDGLSHVENCSQAIIDSGFALVVGPLVETGSTPAYRQHRNFDWLPKAATANRLWSLSNFSNSPRTSRLLRAQAAMAIRQGVDRDSVLAAITSNPARMLGVAEHVGTLAVGKQADLAVFAGDPLDPASPTRLVMSHGLITFESDIPPVETAAVTSATQSLPDRLPTRYAVKSTRVLVDGEFTKGTIWVADGKIVAAEKPDASEGTQVFDLKDTVITPGLVNAHTTLGQTAIINDTTESDSSHLRSVDAIDPSTKAARKSLAAGFVHAAISPGTSNTSGGVVGHLRLGAGDYVAHSAIANQFTLAASARQRTRFPASLNGQVQLITRLFQGQAIPSSVYVTSAVGRSIASEKMANIKSVAEGNRKAIFAANSKLEIRSALALGKKHDLAIVLLSNGPVGDFAKQLAAQKTALIVGPLTGSEYDAQLKQIVSAYQAGVPLAFAGESADRIRLTAALLVNAGIAPKDALLALTQGGAAVVGMNDTGLSPGAPADFVVWSDSPLHFAAKPLSVVVDGQITDE